MNTGLLRLELLVVICLICSCYISGEYLPSGYDGDDREMRDNDIGNAFGSELHEVDVDAQVREKRGVVVCKISGTGPCSGDGECCSAFCVNRVCCLHKNTCNMTSIVQHENRMQEQLEKEEELRRNTEKIEGSIEGSEEDELERGSSSCDCNEISVTSSGKSKKTLKNTGAYGSYKYYKNYNDRPGYKANKGQNYMFYKKGAGYVITNHWRGGPKRKTFKAYVWNMERTSKCPYDLTKYIWQYSRKLTKVKKNQSGWYSDRQLDVRCTKRSGSKDYVRLSGHASARIKCSTQGYYNIKSRYECAKAFDALEDPRSTLTPGGELEEVEQVSYSFRPRGCFSSCKSGEFTYFCRYFNTHFTGSGLGVNIDKDEYILCKRRAFRRSGVGGKPDRCLPRGRKCIHSGECCDGLACENDGKCM